VQADEMASLVTVEAVHRPEPGHRRLYDELFDQFVALYSAQTGTFARLNRNR
jgi:xylulokinase